MSRSAAPGEPRRAGTTASPATGSGAVRRARLRSCSVLVALAALTPAAHAADAATVHPQLWPTRTTAARATPETDAFVAALMAHMSLEEKVAQMIQADIASVTPADLRTYHLGAVLAGGGAGPGGNLRAAPGAWLELADRLHRASMTPNSSAHAPIPILFGIDAVHGDAKVRGATIFPHNIGLGAAHDPALVERIGRATAEEVATTGIDWTFAPTVAVARDVRWGRTYESYSDDPALVAGYAGAMVRGLQGDAAHGTFMTAGHTLSSVKHFIGDGGTQDGRDQGDDPAPEPVLRAIHAAGYPAAIDAGALIVMASFSGWQGVKVHASHELLTTLLKDRFGFDGFIVGDWNAQEEVPGCTKFSCPATIRAGLDMVMAPDSWRQFRDNTLRQVRAGEIPLERIDDAVRRILRVKALAGLFTRPAPAERADAGHFERLGSREHRALARAAVRESLVLLKNEHGILPLSPHAHILVTGDAADRIDLQAGGWTIGWQGTDNRRADFPGATSVYEGIRAAVSAAGGTVTLSAEGRTAQRPDAAIVVFGEPPYAEYEGDLETVEFSREEPDRRSLALLKSLRARGIPTVSVFLSGRPLWVNAELNASDAFVAAWLPGSEGEGIADVLFRGPDGRTRYDFTGRLSFPWPATGMPVRYDGEGRPQGALFARGYGLRYAQGAEVPLQPETPGLAADRGDPRSLFQSAHPTAPWSLFVADALAQVRVTAREQESPGHIVRVQLGNGALRVLWTGGAAGDFWIGGRPADLRSAARAGEVIRARLRVDRSPTGTVSVGLRCSSSSQAAPDACGKTGALNDLTRSMRALKSGAWAVLSLPLACFPDPEALASVAAPLAVRTGGQLVLTFSEVRLVPAAVHRCDVRLAPE